MACKYRLRSALALLAVRAKPRGRWPDCLEAPYARTIRARYLSNTGATPGHPTTYLYVGPFRKAIRNVGATAAAGSAVAGDGHPRGEAPRGGKGRLDAVPAAGDWDSHLSIDGRAAMRTTWVAFASSSLWWAMSVGPRTANTAAPRCGSSAGKRHATCRVPTRRRSPPPRARKAASLVASMSCAPSARARAVSPQRRAPGPSP